MGGVAGGLGGGGGGGANDAGGDQKWERLYINKLITYTVIF